MLNDPHLRGPNLSLNLTAEDPISDHRLRLELHCSSLPVEVARLEAVGGRIIDPATVPALQASLTDPDGNHLDLVASTGFTDPTSGAWVGAIVLRCQEPSQMISFCEEVLRYVRRPSPRQGCTVLYDPDSLEPVLELVAGPAGPARDYRFHSALYSSDPGTEVARLVALGARLHSTMSEGCDFATLLDPDGNPFDVIDKRGCTPGRHA